MRGGQPRAEGHETGCSGPAGSPAAVPEGGHGQKGRGSTWTGVRPAPGDAACQEHKPALAAQLPPYRPVAGCSGIYHSGSVMLRRALSRTAQIVHATFYHISITWRWRGLWCPTASYRSAGRDCRIIIRCTDREALSYLSTAISPPPWCAGFSKTLFRCAANACTRESAEHTAEWCC